MSFKGCEFDYVPSQYERPIARADCTIINRAEHAGYRIWHKPIMEVILQVEPPPYSSRSNDWVVVDHTIVGWSD